MSKHVNEFDGKDGIDGNPSQSSVTLRNTPSPVSILQSKHDTHRAKCVYFMPKCQQKIVFTA